MYMYSAVGMVDQYKHRKGGGGGGEGVCNYTCLHHIMCKTAMQAWTVGSGVG